jgi:hypothetical protein
MLWESLTDKAMQFHTLHFQIIFHFGVSGHYKELWIVSMLIYLFVMTVLYIGRMYG